MDRPAPRDRLLDATIDALRRHGVHGTGIAEILQTSGTARQSIYQHFPGGKTELVEVATRRAGSFITGRFDAADAHEHLDTRIDWWIRQLLRHDYTRGCPVAAAALAGSDEPEVVNAAAEVFAEWSAAFAGLLVEAGADPGAAASLGRFHLSVVEGAIMTSRALRSIEPMEDARTHLHLLIGVLLSH